MQNKSKELEKVAVGIALMFGVYWLYAYFLQERMDLPAGVEKMLGLASLYIVGLGLFILMIKGIQGSRQERGKLSGKQLVLCFLLQLLMRIAMPLAGVYSILLMATGAVGLSIFMAKRKMVVLDGERGLVKGEALKSIFTNRGIWIYIVLTVVVMIVK